jgi:hypothetical protein
MRDNERAIREGIRKRAEKGGDMSVGSVLPWLKNEKPQVEKPRVKRFVCWNCESSHPAEIAKDWGLNQVCPKCEDHLFMEAEISEKRRW